VSAQEHDEDGIGTRVSTCHRPAPRLQARAQRRGAVPSAAKRSIWLVDVWVAAIDDGLVGPAPCLADKQPLARVHIRWSVIRGVRGTVPGYGTARTRRYA